MNAEEIEKYFSADKIECLVCGKKFKKLISHLKVHELSADDYKSMFGLPYTRGLCGSDTREKISTLMKERLSDGTIDHADVIKKANYEGRDRSKTRRQKYHNEKLREIGKSLDKNIFRDAVKRAIRDKKHISTKVVESIEVYCQDCGTKFLASGRYANNKGAVNRCSDCRRIWSNKQANDCKKRKRKV